LFKRQPSKIIEVQEDFEDESDDDEPLRMNSGLEGLLDRSNTGSNSQLLVCAEEEVKK
jgi:hypothetical protein